jgi:HSP20 family protein
LFGRAGWNCRRRGGTAQTEGEPAMTRMLTPWTGRLPRLIEFETEFPKWMREIVGPEAGIFGQEGKFMPDANLVETEKAVEVTVELPGMKPEEVKVEMKEGALWITGEKQEEKEEKGKTFHRIERRAGMFRRIFNLPVTVEEEKVEARFADGVLKITLPKVQKVAPKHIEVKV